MKFLIDSMLPPAIAIALEQAGHDAITPRDAGAHNLPDDFLIELATSEGLVIVTENASDFAHVTTCAVILVRKSWWPRERLVSDLAAALDRWAKSHEKPGTWAHWLEPEYR